MYEFEDRVMATLEELRKENEELRKQIAKQMSDESALAIVTRETQERLTAEKNALAEELARA
jgi:hypothetical protein